MKSCPVYKISLFVLILSSHNLYAAPDQDEQLTVNATTTDVEDLSKKEDIKEANKLAAIFQLQKQLVYKLLQNIGITPDKLSPEIKAAINKPQTTNVKAFKAFSKCLDYKDKGKFKEAREQCEEAVKLDPNFALAQQLLQSIPDQQQTMAEIVADHMGRSGSGGLQGSDIFGLNTIPPNEPPLQLPSDLVGEDCQARGAGGGCQVGNDRSSPPCDNNGYCGFYSTFLARENTNGGISLATSPYLNRRAVGIPPSNAGGAISINQIGREANGFLNLQIDPNNQTGQVTAFREGQLNQGSANTQNGQLERNVTDQFTTNNNVTGLELGSYLTGFDFNGRLGNVGGNSYDLFHGAIYFAEGKVTPIDTIKNLGRLKYDGVVNGDFSVNGLLVPCQGTCGSFTSTLNYGAAKLVAFRLEANAEQTEGNLTAAASITARNIGLKPTGEFVFDQTRAGGGGNFQIGTSQRNLTAASGVVAGRPFGSRADLIGGVFAIHGGNISGAGNFGGRRR